MTHLMLIDGERRAAASGATIDVIDPATETVFHRVPAGDADDVARAVAAARRAFDESPWSASSGAERAVLLDAIADRILARREHLASLEVRDNGKPLPEALWDIDDSAGCFRYYAGLARRLDTECEQPIALPAPEFKSLARREPVGVAGAIVPWNFPLLMAAWKVAPALAAGCTMVLKPSEFTSLTALELAAMSMEAGLPRGILNVVTGLGIQAGKSLAEHAGVDKIAFTGSVTTGKSIMSAAARHIKAATLELGGKSPMIVFDEVDVSEAVEWIMFGIFWNQGQVCSATSRVLIHDRVFDAVVDALAEQTRKIRIGNGLDAGVQMGPLISRLQHAKVAESVRRGIADGARLVSGGRRPQHLDRGYFFEPTILADAPFGSEVWNEEVFGPVVCVCRFQDEDEAVRIANRSAYGLAAAVLSNDERRAERVARALRAGVVWVNCSQPTFTEAPWGGYKQSGIGRELGEWGLDNYLETKQITTFDRSRPWGWYIKG